MKIIIITDAWHPQVNGVVRTYEFLSKELRKLGHEVKVVGPCDFPLRVALPGYPEIKLVVKPYKRLKRIIDAFGPDCIHVSAEGPLGWAGRKYCLRHNKKYSTSFHTLFPDYIAKRLAKHAPFLYNPVHNLAKKMVRFFHAPSSRMMIATQSLEDKLRSWDFKNPMHRVSRGVNLDQFYLGEKTKFNDLKGPIALYVGRVAIEKNIDDFLTMEWEGTKVVVGDGPSRKILEQKYPDAVFVGTKQGEELGEYYRSADVFVFPSRTDTFGIVLIEALGSGLPVAAYNVTGPKDIITENFLGALSEDNLGDAAKRALSCGTREQRAQFTRDHFTWESAGKQYETGLVPNEKYENIKTNK